MLLPLLMALGARIPVLHYSDRFVAVNKPAGISVHRNKDTGRRRVVTTQLQRQFRRKVFPAHRLDHRTSGALLFGFDGPTAGKAHDALAAGTKEYLCLLRGGDWPGEGGADVVEEPRCTLCIAAPATGRPHQIRRHAQHLSMPVIGDSKHGDSRVNRWWREERGLDRLALHCLAISLDDVDGEAVSLLAPLEGELGFAASAWARRARPAAGRAARGRTGSHGVGTMGGVGCVRYVDQVEPLESLDAYIDDTVQFSEQ
ncbi:pseudouridine synthase [Aureococcus anophagefferens]|nr:pseudouridine synthase [Aureococcus anophagefferens]